GGASRWSRRSVFRFNLRFWLDISFQGLRTTFRPKSELGSKPEILKVRKYFCRMACMLSSRADARQSRSRPLRSTLSSEPCLPSAFHTKHTWYHFRKPPS